MKRAIGAVVLGLSACGYPLTEAVIHRWGRRGAAVAESAFAGLAIRHAVMVVGGVPARLRKLPAALFALQTIRFAIYLSPGQGRARPG